MAGCFEADEYECEDRLDMRNDLRNCPVGRPSRSSRVYFGPSCSRSDGASFQLPDDISDADECCEASPEVGRPLCTKDICGAASGRASAVVI